MSDAAELMAALGALLAAGIAYAGGPIDTAAGPLFPDEVEAVVGAVPRRQAEFRAGRTYARAALDQLGGPQGAIARTPDRYPLWPAGFTGSISHSPDLCAAIVARSDAYWGLGLDLERADALDPELHAMIGRPEECRGFATPVLTARGPVDRAKLVFAVKEAVFKLCFPLARHWLDFHDVAVDIGDGTFSARLAAKVPHVLGHAEFAGRWTGVAGHVLVVAALPRDRDTGE